MRHSAGIWNFPASSQNYSREALISVFSDLLFCKACALTSKIFKLQGRETDLSFRSAALFLLAPFFPYLPLLATMYIPRSHSSLYIDATIVFEKLMFPGVDLSGAVPLFGQFLFLYRTKRKRMRSQILQISFFQPLRLFFLPKADFSGGALACSHLLFRFFQPQGLFSLPESDFSDKVLACFYLLFKFFQPLGLFSLPEADFHRIPLFGSPVQIVQ